MSNHLWITWSAFHKTSQGKKKIEIHLPSGLVNFSLHLPPLKCYVLKWRPVCQSEDKINVNKVYLDSKLIHPFNLMVNWSCSFEIASDSKLKFMKLTFHSDSQDYWQRLISYAHCTTELLFSLALSNQTCVFSCPASTPKICQGCWNSMPHGQQPAILLVSFSHCSNNPGFLRIVFTGLKWII